MSQQAAVYLVPESDAETVALPTLQRVLSVLGVMELRSVRAYRGAADWRAAYDDYEEMARRDRLGVDAFLRCVERAGDALVNADAEMGGAVESVRRVVQGGPASARRWRPLFGRVMIGRHSIPDYAFEETAWAGNFSVSVYGEGMPEEPNVVVGLLEADREWRGLGETLGEIIGVRMVTKVEVSY